MRDILFRGKQLDNGEWITGFLVSHKHIGDWLIADPIDPSTAGQYTGLTDKNGKKIFEGDILRRVYYPNEDVVIEWNDGSFRFRRMVYPKEYGYESICCVQKSVDCLKIIGNIHDNPELLKEE